MEKRYSRVPLCVNVMCLEDGTLSPKSLLYNDRNFEITKVMDVRPHCPQVSCVTPLEYTVLIDNIVRRIYYERDTNKWFSVKGL